MQQALCVIVRRRTCDSCLSWPPCAGWNVQFSQSDGWPPAKALEQPPRSHVKTRCRNVKSNGGTLSNKGGRLPCENIDAFFSSAKRECVAVEENNHSHMWELRAKLSTALATTQLLACGAFQTISRVHEQKKHGLTPRGARFLKQNDTSFQNIRPCDFPLGSTQTST